jgi:hypothetical protein
MEIAAAKSPVDYFGYHWSYSPRDLCAVCRKFIDWEEFPMLRRADGA